MGLGLLEEPFLVVGADQDTFLRAQRFIIIVELD